MSFMKELAGDGLAQAKFVTLSKLNHAADGFAPGVGIGLRLMGKRGKGRVKNLVHRAVATGSKLLVNDPLLIGLELDRHIRNVRPFP